MPARRMRQSEGMTPRWRIVSFGSAALLVAVGGVLAGLLGGGTGQILAIVLIGLGFVIATALVFLEVGLSEDRERELTAQREAQRERQRERQQARRARPRRLGRPAIERSRGHRRRLR
jgi:outer membrane lipoprotein SlyB